MAALAAGTAAGITGTADTAILDAYAGLKALLTKRLGTRKSARQALDAQEIDPRKWRASLGEDLTASGADGDEEVLRAARRLLQLADPNGAHTGKYIVGTNYGVVGGGPFNAPVTIHNHPLPPAGPEAG